jgi:hypothetical protein
LLAFHGHAQLSLSSFYCLLPNCHLLDGPPHPALPLAAAAPSDKERIANEAINALAKAVTDQGLSLEEYDSILEVAQNDPEVREKIRQRIRPSAK